MADQSKNTEANPKLQAWFSQEASPYQLHPTPHGFRDLMWCPLDNEPYILEYRDDEPWCPGCKSSFEAETHTFIGHIKRL